MATQPSSDLQFSAEGLYRLGLTQQPFADQLPQFEDAARITQLNVAISLLQSGERVIFVRGDQGLGKTTFLHRLVELQPPGLQMAYLRANQQTNAQEVFSYLYAATEDNPELAAKPVERSQVENNVRGARRAGTRPVLVIDDAHELTERASSELLSLWTELDERSEEFGMVFATLSGQQDNHRKGEPTLESHLPQERIHTTHLFPFTEQQTDAYLEHRLTGAGAEPSLLNKSEKRTIFDASAGYPPAIHYQAYRIFSNRLAKRSDDQPGSSPSRGNILSKAKRGWPILAGSGAIIIISAGAAWYLTGNAPLSAPDSDLTLTALPQTNDNAPRSPQPPTGKPLPSGDADRSLGDLSDSPFGLTMPSQYRFSRDLEIDKTTAPDAQQPTDKASNKQDTQPPQPAEEQSDAPLEEAKETTAAEPTQAIPDASETDQWLYEQDGKHFTVQLIGASNRASVADYAARHGLKEQAHIIETRRQGEPWHILLYGSHADRETANAQIQQLPADVRQFDPWPRTFASIEEVEDD